ncbi:MAG: hypothetical protein MZW92_49155 [Comamonadaceae bacterium]|nr:hypothetical protein [Comamonadaceae bacterium]
MTPAQAPGARSGKTCSSCWSRNRDDQRFPQPAAGTDPPAAPEPAPWRTAAWSCGRWRCSVAMPPARSSPRPGVPTPSTPSAN